MKTSQQVTLLGLLLVGVAYVQAQSSTPSSGDELQFNGNKDTTIIDNQTGPQPNNNSNLNNQNQNQNQLQPSSSPATIDLDDDDDRDNSNNNYQQGNLFNLPAPFQGGGGFGGGFGGSFLDSPRGPGSLLNSLFDGLRRHQQTFEQRFKDLERQAGEGQDVSYFNRNGIAYVRTCTTKKVSN